MLCGFVPSCISAGLSHRSHTHFALRLARRPALFGFFSSVTLVWELTLWIAEFVPPLDLVYAPLGIAFHLGTQLTMRINYLRYWSFSYFAFVPEWAEKLGAF